jgi:hypothetical protein
MIYAIVHLKPPTSRQFSSGEVGVFCFVLQLASPPFQQ